jgi:PAS domain-containing protein
MGGAVSILLPSPKPLLETRTIVLNSPNIKKKGRSDEESAIDTSSNGTRAFQEDICFIQAFEKAASESGIVLFSASGRIKQEFLYFMLESWVKDFNTFASADGDTRSLTAIIVRAFPWFISSYRYQVWCRNELDLLSSTSYSHDKLNDLFTYHKRVPFNRVKRLLSVTIRRVPVCRNILNFYWLKHVVEVTENFPYCVYITVPDVSKGFPLVYANKIIEELTGYDRKDMFGNPCVFYDGNTSHDDIMILQLKRNLLSSLPVKASVSMRCANDEILRSTLYAKPMYDINGRYRYIVNMQVLPGDDTSIEQLALIGDFFTSIPNLIPNDEEQLQPTQ